MEVMHFSTPFFSHGGSKSTSATSRVPRQRRRDPMRWLSMWFNDGDGNLAPLPAARTPLVCLDAPASNLYKKWRRLHQPSRSIQGEGCPT
jgi:hypothetical protein